MLTLVASAGATHETTGTTDTLGHTTLEQVVTGGDPSTGYKNLAVQKVNENYVPRDPLGLAQSGRDQRRRSLAYFAQLTDFQLADEESPARVEFVDPGASSAWRPHEAMHPFAIDYSIRQVNAFAQASPVAQGGGARNSMDFALMTGDQADNQQRNETIWVRELMDGGESLNFNTGVDPTGYDPTLPGCSEYATDPQKAAQGQQEAPKYTGVQDFDDYDEGLNPYYYDPDDVRGTWAARGWPTYTGLMDRAQQLQITPEGLDVPWYLTNGNHDVLVQGNEDANQAFERIAIGCRKVLASTQSPTNPGVPDPNLLLAPSAEMLVPPDPQRQFVSKKQIKQIYGDTPQADDHGFAHVDPAENLASNGTASYYAWDPAQTPGVRFISIDTNSEGGQTAEGVAPGSSSGNIDHPQFQWLTGELQRASDREQLIVIFGHHPVRSMDTEVVDEQASPCSPPGTPGTDDGHGHDVNPGCDADPRNSSPVHLGQDPQSGDPRESFVELLERFPNVIAYVPGHTHENEITPFTRTHGTPETADDTLWWEVNTSAVADYPQQHRLIDVMDNRDGTLSIFSAVLDHASPGTAPPAANASNFGSGELASIGRTFSYNDPHADHAADGDANDRNVELLVEDPRPGADLAITKADSPDPVGPGAELTYTLDVQNGGPAESQGTIVTDELPAGVQFVSANASQGSGCSQSVGTVTCELGTIVSGGSATVTIRVRPQSAGQITNRASVTGNVADANPANNSDTETTTVQATADLAMTKSDSPDPIKPGKNLTYTLNVQNTGPSTAAAVTVRDTLPAHVQFVSASATSGSCTFSAGTVTCNLGDVPGGQNRTVTIRLKVLGGPRTMSNTASASSTTTDPQAGNDSDTETTQVLSSR